ncbi:12137_t:CDS:2, partial [Funneliformis caledonium]
QQFLEAVNLLSNKDFEILFNSLEHEIAKALESFKNGFHHTSFTIGSLIENFEDDRNNGITDDFGL